MGIKGLFRGLAYVSVVFLLLLANAAAQTLKPEYAEALQAIEVMEHPVKAYAAETGISASNAGVRIFRAREALRQRVKESCGTCATHGCLDCSCQSSRV